MSATETKINWYTRICVVLFLLFLGGLVFWSFSFGSPPYQITASILLALSLMVVAILADSFNSISFGTIFQLKKEIAKAESEKKEAKDEARELRASLVTLATNVHQSQVTTNISGMDLATLRRVLGVVEASQDEKEKAEDEAAESISQVTEERAVSRGIEDSWEFQRTFRNLLETELFRRFLDKYKIPALELRREVRFDAGIENIDPIMNRNIIYDGYVRTDQKEYFIEASALPGPASLLRADRLYVAIAKVLFYKQVKKVDAELVYLDVIFPEDAGDRYSNRSHIRFLEWFQPAIAGGLLRMETFTLTRDEFSRLKEQSQRNMN